MTYADIIVDISNEKLDNSFQYLVPEKLKDEIQVGMVVSIPFGRGNHVRKGYVVGISGEPKVKGIQLKSVAGIENDQETTESRLIALAGWMKENYGSTMIQALKTVLPIQKKMKAQEKRWITLLISREDGEKLLEELSMTRFKARIRLLEALLQNENGKIETAWASKELGTTASVLRYFEEQGIASVESDEVYRNAVADAENIPHVAPAVLSKMCIRDRCGSCQSVGHCCGRLPPWHPLQQDLRLLLLRLWWLLSALEVWCRELCDLMQLLRFFHS